MTFFGSDGVFVSCVKDHYVGLERVIEILRRAGRLEESVKLLDMAEKSSGRAAIDAGFNYCKGLYEWFERNSRSLNNSVSKLNNDNSNN